MTYLLDTYLKARLDEIVKIFVDVNPYDTRWSAIRVNDDFEYGDGSFAITEYYTHRGEEFYDYIAWFPEEMLRWDNDRIRQAFEVEREERLEKQSREKEKKMKEEQVKLEKFQRNHFCYLAEQLNYDLPLNLKHAFAVFTKIRQMVEVYHTEVVGTFNNHLSGISLVPWSSYLPDDMRSFDDPFFIEVDVHDNSFSYDSYYLRAETLFTYFEEKQK